MSRKGTIAAIHQADQNHQVVTVEGTKPTFRRTPCQECPWVTTNPIGAFPAEAYRISANTAEDQATHKFACHMSGTTKPATCAGFLLRNSVNNLGVRMAAILGELDLSQVQPDERPLYASYKAMAVANGVDPDDPALAKCRADDD